jgi:Kef-type K+ transport system membrane component KefB
LILLGQLGLLSVWLAAAGAIFSFLLGFWSCRLLGLAPAVAAFVGASMTVTSLNPATSAGRGVLLLTVILTLAAFAAKIIAATTLPTRLNRLVIGCGMVPRGEVSLIFAAYGIRTHLLTANLYSAALLVIMLTTFLTPPAIKFAMKRLEDRTASKAAIRCPVDGEPDNCRTFLG